MIGAGVIGAIAIIVIVCSAVLAVWIWRRSKKGEAAPLMSSVQ